MQLLEVSGAVRHIYIWH